MFPWLKFKFAMLFKKPYFGSIMAARQGRVVRHGYMSKLIELECKKLKPYSTEATKGEYFVLEIGSWAGSSAITFAEAIKKYNNGKGRVVVVDAWQSFHGEHVDKPSLAVMERTLKEGGIFDLFLHNIKSAGVEHLIEIKRGWSKDVLPALRGRFFDLIFIDGSHFYKDVLLDLQNSALLLTDGGILCGDDLELQFDEVDQDALFKNKDNDSLKDPKSNKPYHPGVTLALHEFFGKEVSCWKGFWAMRKTNNSWQRIICADMDEGKVEIPKHLK